MLTIGDLDRRIIFYSFTSTKNVYGELERSYSENTTVWAKVYEKSGKQTDESEEMINRRKTYFYIRDNAVVNLTNQFEIKYNEDTYIIDVINEIDGRDRFLEIQTTQKNNNNTD